MRWKPAALTIIGRLLHAALVLTLTTLLFKTVYHAFFLLSAESTTPAELTLQAGRGGNQRARGPAPEEIAESLNTFWMSFDFDHCRNVCEASRIACRLRHCEQVPGVREWD
ncbi:hypothetical protein BU26DRAFT_563279 [Trematosphaeria pertusa]|uniref:Uncharacterized protein n=1 Tax=Trematosphaeria pertusa TaxID=390896 RepID=A0A6A6IM77_9PLEO|nr:uncharacterized protein BU26DRAFT_563279 [Trematosphaeria pertusa]KAF2251337.1 hypothetical protein BU26DRAFT_563279 [Trematosphaeria pertusa]